MTERRRRARGDEGPREAAVWIDHDEAVTFDQRVDDPKPTEYLQRSPGGTEPAFELRTIREIIDRDRVVVSGPAAARHGSERAYTAMTHRPDRLVDVEPKLPTSRHSGRSRT